MKRSLGWLMILSSGAAFAQTPNAPVLSIGNGFYSDPYGGYPCYIADTKFTGTAGTNTTVSWNGSTITGPTYSTLQAAISAAAAAYVANSSRPTRACALAGETYINTNMPLYINANTGTVATASAPFVIQGDPAATSSTMPVVNGNGGTEGGFAIGSAPSQSNYTGGNDNRYTVIRKIEVTNFSNTATGVYGLALGTNNGGRYDGFIMEYSKLHLFRYSLTGGEGGAGPVYTFNPNVSDTFEIRYSKLYDSLGTDGTTGSRPFAAIETYGGTFNIHHNEIYATPTAFSGKVLTPTVPNGTFHHNLVHDVGNNGTAMIEGEAGGEGPGFNGFYVYNNLFYWTNYNNSVFGTPASNSVYSDTGANGNKTAPTDIRFYNNTIVQALGSASSLTLWNVNTTAVQFYNNVILGPAPIVTNESAHNGQITFCDYNVYFNPTTFYLNLYGSPGPSFGSLSSWRAAHSSYPTLTGLTANPDVHSVDIHALSSSWNTVAANFPNNASNNYTIAAGSPLKGAGQGGVDPGYNPNDVGPGW